MSVIALSATYSNMFLVFEGVALVLAMSYIVALIKETHYPAQAVSDDLPLAAQK